MDGQLSTTITAKPGHWITRVQLREDGDFGLAAWKTDSDAMVRAILIPTIEIYVDGKQVDSVVPDVSYGIGPVAGGLPPTTLSDGSFWLSQFTTNILDPVDLRWAAELDFDVESHLADRGISGKATSVYLTFDNRLRALALEGADAMIIKKMASITATGVPMLLGMAMMALLGVRRRRRRA